ncbi:MAG: hypothetical protein Ct9H300mP3_11120 [Gammaproteobacteria bacterium]|nr:MAG: hypothetical protein Ct9H300mP3_11120 [Gammaproteobacteria bacterium]
MGNCSRLVAIVLLVGGGSYALSAIQSGQYLWRYPLYLF